MHCFSFLIWGDPKGDFVMRVAHQQTEARNDPSVQEKAEIRGQFLFAQPPHDAQNRLKGKNVDAIEKSEQIGRKLHLFDPLGKRATV
jgi:hypothetical protein